MRITTLNFKKILKSRKIQIQYVQSNFEFLKFDDLKNSMKVAFGKKMQMAGARMSMLKIRE